MSQENLDILQGCGREIAVKLIQNAINSGSSHQIRNQLIITYYSSIHILATLALNDIELKGRTLDQCLADNLKAITQEYDFMRENSDYIKLHVVTPLTTAKDDPNVN